MAQEVELGGLRFTAGTPRIVAEGLGFCWYPSIRRFPTGELLVSYSKNPDSAENLTNVNGLSLSKDEGATWSQHADVSGLSGRLNISLSDGSLAGPNQPYKPDPLGQWRTFVGNYGRIGKGGQQYSVDLWGARIEGLPRDVKARTVQSPTRWAEISPFTHIIELEPGRHLATTYLTFAGDDRYSTVVMTSEDGGRTWHYLSTVATAEDGADSWEGFCESSLVRLEDGDLMCVGRMGGGRDQLLARSYSSDEGKSWSPIDRLPAWGVLPQVNRLSNGALVISCGRPGLFIWFSTDPRGEHWEPFDLMAHHNEEMGEAHQISPGKYGLEPVTREQYYTVHHNFDLPDQTTSYTSMLEVEPGRLLIVYDRMPYGWMPVPTDAEVRSRILARYAVSNLAPDSMTPDERERIYLLELDF
ncbi:MAG: sialidase family protein [Caldilineaceae bacterium]|uniref:Exo-alpha-sialidase n=1 Tax=Caldilineaceae bacterium SB0675_bin_29 TaxID=2605266 RepID=A0A6B1G2X0_9CHLR|nr:sialidase family protein [Caldilineaceae bacterium]MYH61766.1 exo-alpha-sialidase [Caldilineaceae bacterium SB0675_bin_29]